MANTTNLNLVKPAGTDHALISVLNGNSDKIDEFAGNTNDSLSAGQNGLAYIVGNTNTTGGTLAVGQFVYVKGHSTIAEGLRKVTSSISANGSITTSNTAACSEGGLNALNSNISTLFKKQTVSAKVIDSGSLTAGAYGYIDVSITIPSGYKTTGAMTIAYGHPGMAAGLQISGGIESGKTGAQTISFSYYSPKSIAYNYTDFVVTVLCIKSDYVL
jgi:hypothetical protein